MEHSRTLTASGGKCFVTLVFEFCIPSLREQVADCTELSTQEPLWPTNTQWASKAKADRDGGQDFIPEGNTNMELETKST